MTLAVATTGVILAAISLLWQVWVYRASRPRVLVLADPVEFGTAISIAIINKGGSAVSLVEGGFELTFTSRAFGLVGNKLTRGQSHFPLVRWESPNDRVEPQSRKEWVLLGTDLMKLHAHYADLRTDRLRPYVVLATGTKILGDRVNSRGAIWEAPYSN